MEDYKGDRNVLKITINDISQINQSIPKSQVLLKTALGGKLEVELKDGTMHLMDKDEVQNLASKLPSWMVWVVKIPFILAFNPEGGKFVVLGDEWQKEAIARVLKLDEASSLKFGDVERLIMEYGSLVFIMFSVDISSLLS